MAVVDASEIPAPPKRRADLLNNSALNVIRPAFRRNPGAVVIDKNDERFRVEIDYGNLQPGRRPSMNCVRFTNSQYETSNGRKEL